MARKPLINMNETYNENSSCNRVSRNPTYNMLLSGNMTPVKRIVVNAVLQKKNAPVLVINLDDTNQYMNFIGTHCDFSLHGNSGYDLFSSMSIRDACTYLQNATYEKQYGDDQTVQIIRYLDFIEKLNAYLGLKLPTIRDINEHYYQPDVIGSALTQMYQTGMISPKEYERLNVSLIRAIKGQLIIDNILVSTDFNLHYDKESDFSVHDLKNGQVAILDLSAKHNSHTEAKSRQDVLYSIEECNRSMILLLNVGRADYRLVSSFITSMTARTNCQLVVIMDDVFSQVPEYDRVRRTFSLNLLGQHTGESCRKMSECFHEVYRKETHYASAVNNRILSERFIDVLFNRNHTDTTTIVPVKRRIIEEHDIANLSDRAFIIMDNTGTINYFSMYNI